MRYFQNQPPRGDAGPPGAVTRWFQAVTGHVRFGLFAGLLLGISLVPAVLCVYGFFSTGALIYVLGWTVSGAAAGPVWTAVQRAAWEIQFGRPCYLYKCFLRWLSASLRQGAALGCLYAALWTLLLSPAIMTLLGGAPLPVWLLILVAAGALALAAAGGYAFYQAARWELGLGEILVNSLLLLFAAGWRSILSGAMRLALPAAMLFWYPVVFPLCAVTGLPVQMCVTIQAATAPAVDRLMEPQGEPE